MNQLESLRKFTTVVVDSGDIKSIKQYKPNDATTNPTIILNCVLSKKYKHIINNSIIYAKKIGGTLENKIINACDMISVVFGCEILKNIPGYVSTEIDAKFSFNKDLCIEKSIKIINLYRDFGVDTSRVLIKLASTWESIQAAKYLKTINIFCNLTLLFSFAQAQACADAEVFLISPFIGRIYDWYNVRNLINLYEVDKDPGVIAVKNIFYHYKKHGYKTIIMGASFRRKEQVLALAGCDKLTISPNLLYELKNCNLPVQKKLDSSSIKNFISIPKTLSRSEFQWLHNQDSMAVEKLSHGICQFDSDQKKLEKYLSTKL